MTSESSLPDALRLYDRARELIPESALVALDVRPGCVQYAAAGQRKDPVKVCNIALDISAQAAWLSRQPLDNLSLETGIQVIEEAIMPAAIDPFLPDAVLVISSEKIHDLLMAAGLSSSDSTLHRDTIENLFNLLAEAVSRGYGTTHQALQAPATAGILLLVRELLHHWRLSYVRVVPMLD